MKMVPVQSSNVKAIGYDPATLAMHVQFRSGATYHHNGVLPRDHKAFMDASSKGSHYAGNFKGKHTGRQGK